MTINSPGYKRPDHMFDTDSVYEGIDISSVTFGAAYYFMRIVKGVIELNVDLLSEDAGGPPYVGHQSKENCILVGFDAAY